MKRIYRISLLCACILLPYFSQGQTECSIGYDYADADFWSEQYKEPKYTPTGQILTSEGEVLVSGGAVLFNDVGCRADKRVYRSLGRILGDVWEADVRFNPI